MLCISSDHVQVYNQIILFDSAYNGIHSTQGCTAATRHGVTRKGRKNKNVCRKVDRKCPLILDLKPFGPKVKREAF